MPKYNEYKQKQKLKQQQTAYQARLTRGLFRSAIKWLEKYVEVAFSNNYPNWQFRKQIRSDEIKRTDIIGNPKRVEKFLATSLYGFEGDTDNSELLQELKEEYYKWIDAVGFDDNCPERLKHFLVGFHEILEGNGEKINRDAMNRTFEVDPSSQEYADSFANSFIGVQMHLQNERRTEKSLEGKNWRQLKNENKFEGNVARGKRIFEQIAKNHDYQNFYFWPQRNQWHSAGLTNAQVVQDIKTNPQNWNIDEIPTEINSFGELKKDIVLYHRNAQLDDFDQLTRKLNFDGNPIYRWENFSVLERFEIKKSKGISAGYLTDNEVDLIVREFQKDPNVWRIGEIFGKTCLIHDSAQRNDNEFGTLIHSKKKFNDLGWKIIESSKMIGRVKQNISEWEIKEIIVFRGPWELGEIKELALVHREADLKNYGFLGDWGRLVIDPQMIYLKKNQHLEEWNKIQRLIKNNKIIQSVEQYRDFWTIQVVSFSDGNNCETLINNSGIEGTILKEDAEFYCKTQFSDEEWFKIENSIKGQSQQQEKNSIASDKNQLIQSNFGGAGLIITLTTISILLLVGFLAIARKKLSNRGRE